MLRSGCQVAWEMDFDDPLWPNRRGCRPPRWLTHAYALRQAEHEQRREAASELMKVPTGAQNGAQETGPRARRLVRGSGTRSPKPGVAGSSPAAPVALEGASPRRRLGGAARRSEGERR